MHVKGARSDRAKKNLNFLCDMEVIVGLPCLIPLLECFHGLIKITQGKNIFVWDFVEFLKVAQQEFFKL
jgi:hypothetical protein